MVMPLGPVGIAAAALGGLITGGLGVLRARNQAKQNAGLAQKAQSDLAANYQDMLARASSANGRLASLQTADAATAAQAVAPAQEQIGNPAIQTALKYGGLGTISTSMFGDTSTPNTARRRLLNI